jgi:hypothetical protein
MKRRLDALLTAFAGDAFDAKKADLTVLPGRMHGGTQARGPADDIVFPFEEPVDDPAGGAGARALVGGRGRGWAAPALQSLGWCAASSQEGQKRKRNQTDSWCGRLARREVAMTADGRCRDCGTATVADARGAIALGGGAIGERAAAAVLRSRSIRSPRVGDGRAIRRCVRCADRAVASTVLRGTPPATGEILVMYTLRGREGPPHAVDPHFGWAAPAVTGKSDALVELET